jgi:hypothetical protein
MSGGRHPHLWRTGRLDRRPALGARAHPRDAIFISPPQKWDFYESDWRVFSERSAVVTFTELLEIGLVPDHLPEWQTRFEKLVPGARAQFTGDFFHNRALTADIFYTRTATDLQAIAARIRCDLSRRRKTAHLRLPQRLRERRLHRLHLSAP